MIFSITASIYPGLLIGVRTYTYPDEPSAVVFYIPFFFLAISYQKINNDD